MFITLKDQRYDLLNEGNVKRQKVKFTLEVFCTKLYHLKDKEGK